MSTAIGPAPRRRWGRVPAVLRFNRQRTLHRFTALWLISITLMLLGVLFLSQDQQDIAIALLGLAFVLQAYSFWPGKPSPLAFGAEYLGVDRPCFRADGHCERAPGSGAPDRTRPADCGGQCARGSVVAVSARSTRELGQANRSRR